jgi:hypothetical protein
LRLVFPPWAGKDLGGGSNLLTERKKVKFWSEEKTVVLLRVLLSVLAVILLVQTLHKAFRAEGYDFTPRLEAAKALVAGIDPYKIPTPFPLTYPLFICVLLLPLAWLPYGLANFIWFGVNAVSLWFPLCFLVKSYDARTTEKEFLKLFALSALLLLTIVQNNFVNGQVNFPVLAFSVLFFKFLTEKKTHWASLFLAAAIALKLTPLLFVVYLLFRKEWAALAWTFFYTAIFILGLPALIAGPNILRYYRGYVVDYVWQNLGYHHVLNLNQVYYLSAYFHFILPFLGGLSLNLLASAAVVAPLVWLQLRSNPSLRTQTLLFSLYAVSILWILPYSETHHMAFLFPAVFLLVRHFLWEKKSQRGMGIFILAWLTLGIWLGKLSFVAFFIAIGTCYFSLAWMLWKEVGRGKNHGGRREN